MAAGLLNPGWTNLGAPITTNQMLVAPTNGATFYRVFGQ
jgi:hypothetical protein